MTDQRPDPDALLRELKLKEETRTGKLKIFFGYAAGVGKTYAMLEAAHHAKEMGVDVVAGYIEPHVRPETLALLDGLEQLPNKEIPYKNITLREFDLDGALARKPQLILVDELAHTNAAGSRHRKRYQDIEELLRAGISVYTTVNVQHLESLNDVVASITGIAVAERLPEESGRPARDRPAAHRRPAQPGGGHRGGHQGQEQRAHPGLPVRRAVQRQCHPHGGPHGGGLPQQLHRPVRGDLRLQGHERRQPQPPAGQPAPGGGAGGPHRHGVRRRHPPPDRRVRPGQRRD